MLQYLTAKIEDQKDLYFAQEAWDMMHQYKQEGLFRKEKGGVLLGKERSDSIEIIEATIPQKNDFSSRFSFHRKSRKHQKIATERWANSDSTTTYFGEWHTHPQRIPTPSNKDLNTWNNKLSGYSVPLILVIIGIDTDWVGVMMPEGKISEIQLQ